jgi:ABC-2 type transport system permease protein
MNFRWIAFRALVRKDLLAFVRDRRALIVSVLTPILIAAFFGYLFGGDHDDAERGRMAVAVVDLDGSDTSRQVAAGLAGEASLATELTDAGRARERVREGKVRVAVVLPQGFGAAARRALFGGGEKPVVELLYDPSQTFARPVVEGLLTLHVMQTVTRELFSANGSTTAIDATLADVRASDRLAPAMRGDLTTMLEAVRTFQARQPPATAAGGGAGGGMTVPFGLSDVAVSAGPRYNGYAHSFAGMSVQFILFMGIDAGVGILLQRQTGVWRRLRAAPLSRGVLLGARCVATTLIALGILAVVYLVAILVFGVRIHGSLAGFVAVAVAFALFTSATGLLIAALGRSVPATRGLSMFVVLLLVMLGGAWVPSFVFPAWLQRATVFVPTRWAVDGLDAMTWRGLPLSAAVAPVAVLLGTSVLFALLALWRFDWEAD